MTSRFQKLSPKPFSALGLFASTRARTKKRWEAMHNYLADESSDDEVEVNEILDDALDALYAGDEDDEMAENSMELVRVVKLNAVTSILIIFCRKFNLVQGFVHLTPLFGEFQVNDFRIAPEEGLRLCTGQGQYNFTINSELKPIEGLANSLINQPSTRILLDESIIEELLEIVNEDQINEVAVLRVDRQPSVVLDVFEYLNPLKVTQSEPFEIDLECRRLPIEAEWKASLEKEIVANLTTKSRIVICGEKSSGKSSLVRWLGNKWLSSNSGTKYLVLDLDPGQPEFDLPATLSLICVKSPLFGPPFTNQLFRDSHEILFSVSVGGVNVEQRPDAYLNGIRHLWAQYEALNAFDGPLLVNTMGWLRGIGINLMVDILDLVKPTNVLEIRITDHDRMTLCSENVAGTSGWALEDRAQTESSFNYKHLELPLERKYAEGHVVANNHRLLRQLAYIANISSLRYKPLKYVEGYRIPLKGLFIHIGNSYPPDYRIVLDILLKSWVQLCFVTMATDEEVQHELEQDKELSNGEQQVEAESFKLLEILPKNQCLGCAIIVDFEQGFVRLLTPEPVVGRLERVNCLVMADRFFVPSTLEI